VKHGSANIHFSSGLPRQGGSHYDLQGRRLFFVLFHQ